MTISSVIRPDECKEGLDSKRTQLLEKENRILFDQLQVVQEKLESLHNHQQTEIGSGIYTVVQVSPVDGRYLEGLAENIRLEVVLRVKGELDDLQTRYALANQLGEVLLEGAQSTGALLSVPGRLRQVWRKSRRTLPPASLGGKSYDKVIHAYRQGGKEQVELLLSRTGASSAVQASAWTALARTLMTTDSALVVDMARHAFALEPRGFRQKWLAFRLHEAGELLEAEALLTLLPTDIQFTESETRQKERLFKQAKQQRLDQVRRQTDVDTHQAYVASQWEELAQSRNALATTVEQQRRQLLSLQNEIQELNQQYKTQSIQVDQLSEQTHVLRRELDEGAQERLREVDNYDEVLVLQNALNQEKSTLLQSQQECRSSQTKIRQLEEKLSAKELEAEQWFEQCATLQAGLAEMIQELEKQKKDLEHFRSLEESLLSQIDVLKLSNAEQSTVASQNLNEKEVLRKELEALALECEKAQQQSELEQFERKALQQQLIDAINARQQQSDLAAQRQGELLELTREQLALDKTKTNLEVRCRELECLLATQMARETNSIQSLISKVEHSEKNGSLIEEKIVMLTQTVLEELKGVGRHLETVIKNNSANSVRQIQSFVGMQEYFATGILPAVSSERHTWPISADFALSLMKRLVFEKYDLVIEFGSGISTVIVAKTLALSFERRQPSDPPHFVSFDHLDTYFQQTLASLKQAGLEQNVQLVLAPLQEWSASDGKNYSYYSCQPMLKLLAEQSTVANKRILVIVDGPPALIGVQARYPAAPLIMQYFPDAYIDFFMDDYIRDDEKQVAKRWLTDIRAQGREGGMMEYKFEKDACLVTAHPKDTK
nr:hypothetical protein [Alcaligenes faecalis]